MTKFEDTPVILEVITKGGLRLPSMPATMLSANQVIASWGKWQDDVLKAAAAGGTAELSRLHHIGLYNKAGETEEGQALFSFAIRFVDIAGFYCAPAPVCPDCEKERNEDPCN